MFTMYLLYDCFLDSTVKPPAVETVHINISIDGLPLHDSGPAQFWPILIDVFELPEAPVMTVGLFCGNSKPGSLEQYLRPLVEEINVIQESGVVIGGKPFQLRLRAIIADSPARAFVKGNIPLHKIMLCYDSISTLHESLYILGVASFNAKSGCLKCTCVGTFHTDSRKVIFPPIAAPPRTDQEFRATAYGNHHQLRTPLLDIKNLDMIEDIVIADRLHLLDHGITKKLLMGWCNGRLGSEHRWTPPQKEAINKKLQNIKLPSEVHRDSPRSMECLGYWKGTEFRNFLHYSSVGILRESLDHKAYDHFMLYFCAVTLLSSNIYRQHWRLAGTLLERFVVEFDAVYGPGHISSNVHQLLHVVNDVLKFGNLETISSYRFESFMQTLKHKLRSGYKSLEQVVNRTAELAAFDVIKMRLKPSFPRSKQIGNEVVLYVRQGFILRAGNANEWFMAIDNSILQYKGISDQENSIRIVGRRLSKKAIMFQGPVINSEIMHMYVGRLSDLSDNTYHIPLSHVK